MNVAKGAVWSRESGAAADPEIVLEIAPCTLASVSSAGCLHTGRWAARNAVSCAVQEAYLIVSTDKRGIRHDARLQGVRIRLRVRLQQCSVAGYP